MCPPPDGQVQQIIPLALANGTACILAYGQTGTGKTYTMEALEYRIARDLFVAAKKIGDQLPEAEQKASVSAEEPAENISTVGEEQKENGRSVFEFSVTFLELLGKRVVDLLEPVEGLPIDEYGNPVRSEVPVSEDKVRFLHTYDTALNLINVCRMVTSVQESTRAQLNRRNT